MDGIPRLISLVQQPDGLASLMYRLIYRRCYQKTVPQLAVEGMSKVVVLAPHPDDETIGAMGAILLHQRHGADITVVFCNTGSSDEERRTRHAEGMQACRTLGVTGEDLGWTDHAFVYCAERTYELGEWLRNKSPDVIYLPAPIDPQPQHVVLNFILAAALRRYVVPTPPVVRLYGVLAPIPVTFADWGVGLEREWTTKKVLLYQVYRSQVGVLDFRRILLVQRLLGTHLHSHAGELYVEPRVSDWVAMVDAVRALGGVTYAEGKKSWFSWRHPMSKFNSIGHLWETVVSMVGASN